MGYGLDPDVSLRGDHCTVINGCCGDIVVTRVLKIDTEPAPLALGGEHDLTLDPLKKVRLGGSSHPFIFEREHAVSHCIGGAYYRQRTYGLVGFISLKSPSFRGCQCRSLCRSHIF